MVITLTSVQIPLHAWPYYKCYTNIVFPAINDRTSEYNKNMKSRFDAKKIIKEPFPEGAMVMICESKRQGALQAKYSGPYKILRWTRGGAYELLNPLGKHHPTKVSPDLIKCIDGIDDINLTGVFEVAYIINHLDLPKDHEYLVHRKGYSSQQDSWEPVDIQWKTLHCGILEMHEAQ